MKDILDSPEDQIKSSPGIKNKHILILFLIGWIITLVGSIFKINSMLWGGAIINIGIFIKIISGFLAIIKLSQLADVKSFWNK